MIKSLNHNKKIKFFLFVVLGILLGLTIHGLVEILAIWILLNWLKDLFFGIPWNSWSWIHIVSVAVVEILSLFLVFRVYKREKNRTGS